MGGYLSYSPTNLLRGLEWKNINLRNLKSLSEHYIITRVLLKNIGNLESL
jgi:hypothetical protein